MAQPDFPSLTQALHGLGEQLRLVPNMPGLVDVPGILQDIIARLDKLSADVERLPIRVYNLAIDWEAPIFYPTGVDVEGNNVLPRTKQQLSVLTAEDAQKVSDILGLPNLPGDPTVAARRQQIINFLGCNMQA